jgi:hypothetical protein
MFTSALTDFGNALSQKILFYEHKIICDDFKGISIILIGYFK